LLGSQAIAASYRSQGKVVAGMMQLDMTGFVKDGTTPKICIITDFTDAALSQFVRQLVDTYTESSWQNGACGYGCSDHASWNRAGFRSSFPFEAIPSDGNPRTHTPGDLLQYLNPAHMFQFAKLGLSYVVELSLAQ